MKESTGAYEDYIYLCIKSLQEYYKNKNLTIIGLNDSQGVNITSTFLKKCLLEYISSSLKTSNLDPTVINAFSLLMNKTEHIDYFLKYNLSLEEIKLSQIYSAVSSLQKVMKDINLPEFLGNIGYLYGLTYRIKEDDNIIRITNELQNAEEPILIYSSGVNNLMRDLHNNPFSIKKDYKNRKEKPNFYYTLEKSQDPTVLKNTIDNIERNIYNILSINAATDIYTLGAYIPPTLQVEEMNIFKDLILKYNESLEKLCKEYQITYIDTKNIGNHYNKSKINFHISSKGHNELANYILIKMYENKFNRKISNKEFETFTISNDNIEGIINEINLDYLNSLNTAQLLSGYKKEVMLQISQEHKREKEVFKKVLTKKQ